MHTEQPFYEELRERAIAVLSTMLLYMQQTKQETAIFRESFPVGLLGELAKKEGTDILEYDMTIIVKKKRNIPRYTIGDLLKQQREKRKDNSGL
jgi:hypothetical protein